MRRVKLSAKYNLDSTWTNGPKFLYEIEEIWQKQRLIETSDENVEELRSKYVCVATKGAILLRP